MTLTLAADPPQDIATVSAAYNAALGTTLGYLQPHANLRRIVLMAINGPASSTLKIFRGYNPRGVGAPINSVFPADGRTYDSTRKGAAPMTIWPGEALTFIWTGGRAGSAGATGTATVTSEVEL